MQAGQRALVAARGLCAVLAHEPASSSWCTTELLLRQASGRGCSSSAPEQTSISPKSPRSENSQKALRYRSQLSDLRRQWAEETEKRRSDREQKRLKGLATQQRQQAVVKRGAQQQKQLRAAEQRKQQAVMQEIQAARRAQAQDWRVVTAAIHETLDRDRHEDLLAWSRSWITRDTLEQRIQDTLDHPVLLFPGEDQLVDSGFPSLDGGDDEDPDSVASRTAEPDDDMAAQRAELDEGSDDDLPHRPGTQRDLR